MWGGASERRTEAEFISFRRLTTATIVAAFVALCLATPASALDVHSNWTDYYAVSYEGSVEIVDSAGERNDVSVQRDGGFQVIVHDAAAPVTGDGTTTIYDDGDCEEGYTRPSCEQVDAHTVRCELPDPSLYFGCQSTCTQTAALGGGDDSLVSSLHLDEI